MELYIQNYNLFDKTIVYNFELGYGGIGDCIKFFMYTLENCINNNIRLYYKKNNIEIEKYIKLKYDMYIDDPLDYEIVEPFRYYSCTTDFTININEVFYFTEEVIQHSYSLFSEDNYISIHLRLGDKYLETDNNYVCCKEDTREFSEEKMETFIKENHNETIFFCCDNHSYKLKMKEKYNIIITNCDIGHTSLTNTTAQQTLDAVTELYILTKSKMIYSASKSGFSLIASKFNNIPLFF
jgi:hypothetical protein